ncbi:MAG TPA: hypothetical protein VN673_04915 [Clostridia bacterium]|nr:hypothetical protein [Clostridia bacterium]
MENGTLMNLHSALVLDGANGPPLVQGGSLVQEGGTLTATNASLRTVGGALSFTNAQADFDTLWLGISPFHAASTLHQAGGFIRGSVLVDNASYNLLGGTFSGDLKIGKYTDGFFRQFAGTNRSAILEIGISPFGRGHYTIDGGCLLASSIRVGNAPVGRGWFAQAGGEIEVDFLQIGAGGDYYQASIGNFFLTNGTLRTGRVVVTDGRFVQAGGHHSTAASLSMNGVYHEDRYGLVSMTPKYILEGGTFVSPGIILNAWSIFEQFGGTNFVQGSLSVSNTEYGLHDGCLSTSNTIIDGSGFKQTASFVQKGGNHAVSGTLSILGNYHLSGGTLVSSNILLSGRLVVTAGVLMNAGGVLLMAGELDLRSGSQSLGELQLLDHSLINFGTAPGALHFQVSASRPWKPGKLLAITNWNGQLNGSGS